MKRFLCFLVASLLCLNFALAVDVESDGGVSDALSEAVSAVDNAVSSLVDQTTSEDSSDSDVSESSPNGNNYYILMGSQDDASSSESVVDSSAPLVTADIPDDAVITDVSVFSSLSPVTPDDATGLKKVMLQFLGNYDPVVVVYQYNQSGSGYSNYVTQAQLDYPWICSAGLCALFVYCLFKLGGGLLTRG